MNSTATFYQASDGQALFPHPFNILCLEHQFGSLDQCPQVIAVRHLYDAVFRLSRPRSIIDGE